MEHTPATQEVVGLGEWRTRQAHLEAVRALPTQGRRTKPVRCEFLCPSSDRSPCGITIGMSRERKRVNSIPALGDQLRRLSSFMFSLVNATHSKFVSFNTPSV